MKRHDPALAGRLYAGSALEAEFALQIRATGLPEPEREFKFHESRKWRLDFCWPAHRLAVEIDGGIFSGGRHVRGKGFENDCEKLNAATAAGWSVLRFTGKAVKSGEALQMVEQFLAGRVMGHGTG